MATGSKGGRSYSDQSYGSIKTLTMNIGSGGTRATELVARYTAMNPMTIVDWYMANTVLGTGGSSQWVLAATSANGTSALGTSIWVGTHGPGAVLNGSVATEVTIPTGGALDVYSVLSTAAPTLQFQAVISYRESFVVSDN
jgi:hypothetical protein